MDRDHNAEAAALPHFQFDLLMHDMLLRTFEPFMDGVSALEMGCFEGNFTRLLRETYPDLTVVEASAQCIAKARARVPTDVLFIHSTFEAAELDRRYDAIFLTHVLEHLDVPVLVLKRAREWLLPGGRIFIAVPNAHAASRQIAAHMGIMDTPESVTPAEAVHGHRRTYSRDALLLHIAQAGLKLAQDGGVCFKPMANFQLGAALDAGVIDDNFLQGCYKLGRDYPELCASLYAVCE